MKQITTNSGAKAHQRQDTEDRAKAFRDWHRTLGPKLYAVDIDLLELRKRADGSFGCAAVLEVTRVDGDVSDQYLAAILARYDRGLQSIAAPLVAQSLGAKAWIVLFREDCSRFWVYNLSDRRGWWQLTAQRMELFLANLKAREP